MSKPTRRPGSAVYYARRAVPRELRETYAPTREKWKSLGVMDYEAAKPLERLQQIAWDEEFAAARAKLLPAAAPTAPRRPLTPAQQAERERQQFEWERENEVYWAENDPYPDYEDLTPEEQRIRDAVEAARERWEQQQREDREFARQPYWDVGCVSCGCLG